MTSTIYDNCLDLNIVEEGRKHISSLTNINKHWEELFILDIV